MAVEEGDRDRLGRAGPFRGALPLDFLEILNDKGVETTAARLVAFGRNERVSVGRVEEARWRSRVPCAEGSSTPAERSSIGRTDCPVESTHGSSGVLSGTREVGRLDPLVSFTMLGTGGGTNQSTRSKRGDKIEREKARSN